jgi:hypothetical protein
MSNADDAVVIRAIIQKLQSHVDDLNVDLGEEGSLVSPALQVAETILQDAIDQLEAVLKH